MVKFTSIVMIKGGVVRSVRAHAGWMDDVKIDAYLDGIEGPEDGLNLVFNCITLHSDIGESDGGWTSAHQYQGRWLFSKGS